MPPDYSIKPNQYEVGDVICMGPTLDGRVPYECNYCHHIALVSPNYLINCPNCGYRGWTLSSTQAYRDSRKNERLSKIKLL